MSDLSFDYKIVDIKDITVQSALSTGGQKIVTGISVEDETLDSTDRFWDSIFARFSFSGSIFKYFSHEEVFNRISEVVPNERIRVCVERNGTKDRVLAVSAPTKPIVKFDQLSDLLGSVKNTKEFTYSDGMIQSFHQPRVGVGEFEIGGDKFLNEFVMATPVDGYGLPKIYLSLLRLICSNGVAGYSKAFCSQLSLGKGEDNIAFAILRTLDQFNNDEGYAALRNRIDMASKSWASVYEANTLYRILIKMHNNDERIKALTGSDGASLAENAPYVNSWLQRASHSGSGELSGSIIGAFHKMTHDINASYGLAHIDALSQRRQQSLPVRQTTVYDLVNFATEIATHYANPVSARTLNAYVGSLISDEYNLENSCSKFPDFADFHVTSKLEHGLTGSVN